MTHNLDRMNQRNFQPLEGAESRADVLKEKFSLSSPKINDSQFRKSKHWYGTLIWSSLHYI